ncbi:MAG: ATP-grasp domain-containing protein [Ignavibacteria bacterium]|nr:ATP-grasp domain-containing protein [Ignavibacteria bacterium]
MRDCRASVVVLYNHVGDDEYEKMKEVDPSTLDFKPEYDIHVSTVEEEYKAVVKALRKENFRARAYNLKEDIRRLHRLLSRNPPDVIFNLVEYFHDDSKLEAQVAGMYELFRVAYTGASPFALNICQRKGLAKQILLANDVPTPRFKILTEPKIQKRHGLHYPLIVKPAREDASAGVTKDSVVYDYAALKKRLDLVFSEFAPPILVEEFIQGRELHVSVLGNDPPVVLPSIEFDFSNLPSDHPHLISYDVKWNPLDESYHQVHTTCPAKLTKRELKNVEKIAQAAYKTLGCRDYARLDLRLGEHSHVYVLEVNPNPDLTESVSFMESAEEAGISFSQTLGRIVEYALERRVPKSEEPESAPAPVTDSGKSVKQ